MLLKLFGFIPELMLSPSSRNPVRDHPGTAFTLPRIPHPARQLLMKASRYTSVASTEPRKSSSEIEQRGCAQDDSKLSIIGDFMNIPMAST